MLDNVIDRTLLLLFPDSEVMTKSKLLEILQEDGNKQGVEKANQALIPGMFSSEHSLPNDTDIVNKPPILSGLTLREVMLLGAVATILGVNKKLEEVCINSSRSIVSQKGEFLSVADGKELYYKTFGSKEKNKPCIIMQSGLGHGAESWNDVQDLLKDDAYGVSYDRSGLGFSFAKAGENQASAENIMNDFEKLLKLLEEKGKIQTPYILVGHSMGGVLTQLYAHRNPDKVKGIILVDSAHEGLPPMNTYPPHQEFPPEEIMPISTARAIFPKASRSLGVLEEMKAVNSNDTFVTDYIKQETQNHKKFLYNLPLCVISRGQYPENESGLTERQKLLEKLQADIATRSTNVKHVICQPGTDHFIQNQRPEVVVKEIRQFF